MKEHAFDVTQVEPISIDNEIRALSAISQSAAEQLKNFDTTIPEDTTLLAEIHHPSNSAQLQAEWNRRNCIVMRRGEKRVLKHYADMASRVIPFFSMSWPDMHDYIVKHYASAATYSHSGISRIVFICLKFSFL